MPAWVWCDVRSRFPPKHHAMVCEKVAKMTQMRHDNLTNALCLADDRLCLLLPIGGGASLPGPGREDIAAVLPWLELAAVGVVVAHVSGNSCAAQAAKEAGWTAARAERTKRARFRKDVPDHAAFRFVPLAVETCGDLGREAVQLVML